MDFLYYVIVPIFAAAVSGLFTFLGVKRTLSHQKEVHNEELKLRIKEMYNQEQKRNEDLRLREEELKKKEAEIKIEKNKQVYQTRPELTLSKNADNLHGSVKEICLLPFTHARLSGNKTAEFEYDKNILQKNYWEQREIVLQNTGKRKIQSFFLQVPSAYNLNLHFQDEISTWEFANPKCYQTNEKVLLPALLPNEKIKIIIHYPKDYKKKDEIPLDAYIHDEDENFWYQSAVNLDRYTESAVYEKVAFNSLLQGNNNYLIFLNNLTDLTDIERAFIKQQSRNQDEIDKQREQFVKDVNEGKTLLNYRLPIW